MEIKNATYLKLVLFHIFMGVLIFYVPILSKVLTILLFLFCFFIIVKKRNANNEALIFATYVMASEVFFRMTHGVPNNEYGKYSVIVFMLLGIYFSGFSKRSFPYWIYILLLIPGIFVGVYALDFEVNIRKAIAFNLSGPVCLAISAIYTFQRKVTPKQLEFMLTAIIFPIVSMVAYMYLYTPSNRDVFTGTESNFATSGGFGPNQVSTILGLGMFAVFIRLVLYAKTKWAVLMNLILLLILSYRGIITFSRGGVYTGIAMILLALGSFFLISNAKGKIKIYVILFSTVLAGVLVFAISSIQTGGMINKRYAGENARGQVKESKFSGREQLVGSELNMFLDNPITGVGVGVNKQYREELTGIEAASHNEISRMLAEHGILGVVSILILLTVPMLLFLNNRQHIFMGSFYIFWLLTINHAAMRIAAPAFIYALTLLNVSFDEEEPTVYRESIT